MKRLSLLGRQLVTRLLDRPARALALFLFSLMALFFVAGITALLLSLIYSSLTDLLVGCIALLLLAMVALLFDPAVDAAESETWLAK